MPHKFQKHHAIGRSNCPVLDKLNASNLRNFDGLVVACRGEEWRGGGGWVCAPHNAVDVLCVELSVKDLVPGMRRCASNDRCSHTAVAGRFLKAGNRRAAVWQERVKCEQDNSSAVAEKGKGR